MATIRVLVGSLCLQMMVITPVAIGQTVKLTATPGVILKGLTDSLVVNCTFDSGSDHSLIVLRMCHAENLEIPGQGFQELTSVSTFATPSPSGQLNFTTSSNVVSSGQSFLALSWRGRDRLPKETFKCEASGQDLTGHPFNVSDDVLVSGISQQSQAIVDEIVKLRERNDRIDAEIRSNRQLFDNVVASWNAKLNLTKRWLFEQSQEYNGSVYFLSRANLFDNTGIAQTLCEIYHGSLAEIESDGELDFVRNFVSNATDDFYFYYVIIGGVDEGGVNGTWVSPRSETPLTYFNWAQGYPTKDTYAKCLGLWSYVGWKMVNVNCFKEGLDWPKKVLCEQTAQE
ncbi:hypothetical protein Btru_063779 [Bulinus truncatus]|nr:hypothetical protein Btru_063779 [Bulinus truncatus]